MADKGDTLIIRALEFLDFKDKYLEFFKKNDLQDSDLKSYLPDSMQCVLSSVIIDDEDLKNFCEAFKLLLSRENPVKIDASGPQSPSQTFNPTDAPNPVQVSHTPEPANVWTDIAKSLQWTETSKTAIKEKLLTCALDIHNKTFAEESQENASFLEDQEIKFHIEKADDAALTFLETILNHVSPSEKNQELDNLESALKEQAIKLHQENSAKQVAVQKMLDEEIKAICNEYEERMIAQLSQGFISTEEHQAANATVVLALTEAFRNKCSDNPLFSEQDFAKSLESFIKNFADQLQDHNQKVISLVAHLGEVVEPAPVKYTLEEIWLNIAKSLQWTETSEGAIREKLLVTALEIRDETFAEKSQGKDYFLDEKEMESHIESAEDAALAFLEKAVAGLPNDLIDQQLTFLELFLNEYKVKSKDENSKKLKELRKKLKHEAKDMCSQYERLMFEKCGHGLINEFDSQVASFNVVQTLTEDFRSKCSNNPFYSEAEFAKSLQPCIETFAQNLEDHNTKMGLILTEHIAALIQKYLQEMEKVQDFVSFDEVHLTTVAALKESQEHFLMFNQYSQEACWEGFYLELPEARSQAEAALQIRFKNFQDYETKLYYQLIAFYKTETDSVYGLEIPVSVTLMEKLHKSTKTAVLEKFRDQQLVLDSIWNMSGDEKAKRLTRLVQEIEMIKQNALEANTSRWEALRPQVEEIKEELVDQYVDTMSEAGKSLETEKNWSKKEYNEHEKILKEFKSKLETLVQDADYIKEVTSKLDNQLDFEKGGCLDVFRNQLQERKLQHKAALLEAKKFYEAEMELKFTSRPWWIERELKEVHESVLEQALISCRETVELSETVEQDLRRSFNVLLQGYLERNRAKIPSKEPAIGIDLGTTYSCVGVFNDGAVQIIPNALYDGKTTIASYIAFEESGTILIGNEAKEKAFQNPINTVFDAKRLIGRYFNEDQIQQDIRHWPFQVVDEGNNEPKIKVKNQLFTPEEMSAKLLVYLKEVAEKYLKRTVKKAVITVPAYFSGAQKRATKDAAEIAGLEATIINEPTAAALAYNLNRTGDSKKNVLVFDLGGGTFDVVVISMDFGEVKVLSVGGDIHLGGEDFDNAMVDTLVNRVREKYKIDLARGRNSQDMAQKLEVCSRLRRLKSACEEQKRLLSQSKRVEIHIDRLDGDFSLRESFTQDEFNEINESRFKKCISIVEAALKDARLGKQDIDDVVLVGGSTRIPKVQELLEDFFGKEKSFCRNINADEAVARGAAFQAALIHGGQIKDDRKLMKLKDVTPHSLGIKLQDGSFSVVIEKHSYVPCTQTNDSYCTAHDNQTEAVYTIYEGENPVADENRRIGEFKLQGIPPNRAGREELSCIMNIDSEGILHVEGMSTSNGSSEKLTIEEHSGRMTKRQKKAAKEKDLFRWD